MKKIAIIILDYNTHSETYECLNSLDKVAYKDLEIKVFVIDNGSGQKIDIEKIKLKNFEYEVVISEKNLGFAGGNNLGISNARMWGAYYFLFLNNDTIVHKDFLKFLVAAFEENNHIGIVTPKIYFAPNFEFHKDRYDESQLGSVIWYAGGVMDWENVIGHHRGVDQVDKGQFDEVIETDYATGCCFLVSEKVLSKVGVFNERYYLYYEEVDLCMRIKRDGYKILFIPKALVYHKNAASSGGSGSALQDYFISRNRLLFGISYAPIRSKVALILEAIRLLFSGRKWQRKGVRDFFIGSFGKGNWR